MYKISTFISPWKRDWTSFDEHESPSTKNVWCQFKSGWNWPCGSGEDENRQMYRGQTTGDQKSSLELLAPVS